MIEQHANIACSTMSNAQNALLIEQPKQSLGSTINKAHGTFLIEAKTDNNFNFIYYNYINHDVFMDYFLDIDKYFFKIVRKCYDFF